MSELVESVKAHLREQLSGLYRNLKQQNYPEWNEFESWFWKIRPHLEAPCTYSFKGTKEGNKEKDNLLCLPKQ